MELTTLRSLDCKQFDTAVPGQRQAVIQAGQHYKGSDGFYYDSTPDFQIGSDFGTGYAIEGIRLPVHLDPSDGRRRIYLARDKSAYIQFGGYSGLSNWTRVGNTLVKETTKLKVEVGVSPEGLWKLITLKNSTALGAGDIKSFGLAVSLVGATVDWATGDLKSGDGEVLATVHRGFLWDSSPVPIHRPLSYSYSAGVLTFTADCTGLTYPVFIDPQVTKQPATADTYFYSPNETDNNGSGTGLGIGYDLTWKYRAILNFDFSADIAAGSTIDAASMSLYRYTVVGTPGPISVARLLRTDWVELQATWLIYKTANNWTTAGAGSDGNDFTSTSATSLDTGAGNNQWYAWAIAAQVQTALDSVAGVWHGRGKRDGEVTEGYSAFRSSNYVTDTTLRPKLVIDYTAPGGAAAPGRPLIVSEQGYIVGGKGLIA